MRHRFDEQEYDMATLNEQYTDLITELRRRDAKGAEALAQLGERLVQLDDLVREVPDGSHRQELSLRGREALALLEKAQWDFEHPTILSPTPTIDGPGSALADYEPGSALAAHETEWDLTEEEGFGY